jgi:hypothetical protein
MPSVVANLLAAAAMSSPVAKLSASVESRKATLAAARSSVVCAECAAPQPLTGKPFARCSRCVNTQYCSKECQTKAWKAHKKVCTPPPPPKGKGGQTAPPKLAQLRERFTLELPRFYLQVDQSLTGFPDPVVIVFNEYSRRRLVRKKEGLKASAKKSVLKSIKLFFKMERTGGMWDDPSFKVTIGDMCEDVRIAWVYGLPGVAEIARTATTEEDLDLLMERNTAFSRAFVVHDPVPDDYWEADEEFMVTIKFLREYYRGYVGEWDEVDGPGEWTMPENAPVLNCFLEMIREAEGGKGA